MKTVYRTAFWADKQREELVNKLRSFNINVEPNKFQSIEFYDDDKNFRAIKALFDLHKINLDNYSIYTDEECLNAKILGMVGDWHYGYPQPEDGYKEICFDLKNYCSECGIGAQQINPFRIKNEPNWGRRQVFQLNWIFDEFFMKPEIYDKIFRPLFIDHWEVIINKKNIPAKTVVQLNIPIVGSELIMEGHRFDICSICKRKKYSPIKVGGYPQLRSKTNLPIFKSQEFFGSGARAFRGIFVKNNLYKELIKNKIRGVDFVPVFE
jgi:hypothetical protein